MKDITDADYAHARTVSKDFEIKNSGEYYDLYFQRGILLLADVSKMCLEIYGLDPGMTCTFKNYQSKIRFFKLILICY